MTRRAISIEVKQILARECELRLDGSGENCMLATTVLDEDGLVVTGSLESVIEVIAFISLVVGQQRDDEAADDLVNGLAQTSFTGPGLNGEFEVRFPRFHVA